MVDDWFDVADLGGGITRVTEPFVRSLVSANTWWVRGDRRDVVIDTGLGVASLKEHVPAMFEHDPLAVVTHTHLDHAGGAYEFEHVAVHAAEVAALEEPGPSSLHTGVLLDQLGIVAGRDHLPDLLITASPSAAYDPDAFEVRPATATTVLTDGDVIDAGSFSLRVLHLPGHSPGSIVLIDDASKTLFSGDVVYDDELLDELQGAEVTAYVESMRRLLEEDVSVVHPGHGESFDGARLRELAAGLHRPPRLIRRAEDRSVPAMRAGHWTRDRRPVRRVVADD